MVYYTKSFVYLICFIALAGCAHIWQLEFQTPLSPDIAQNISLQFASSLPDEFKMMHSVYFKMGPAKFSSLGFTTINAQNKTFQVVGLNPMGMKLFELTGDDENVTTNFAMEEFKKHGDFAEAIAKDIRYIYFNRVPKKFSSAFQTGKHYIFKENQKDRSYIFVFDKKSKYLIEKQILENNRLIIKIEYKDYGIINNNLHSEQIILNNLAYGYQLIIKLLEIRK